MCFFYIDRVDPRQIYDERGKFDWAMKGLWYAGSLPKTGEPTHDEVTRDKKRALTRWPGATNYIFMSIIQAAV
jgi:hypothetical protein